MAGSRTPAIFDTDRRIRMGIWGLGRGMSFFSTCRSLNIDVVAGCDYNAHMRERFGQSCPGARVTADEDEFLSWDFDAVLLATFCPGHARDALRCLGAGKHVLSEVTAFHTLAEGVELVEAVEKSGLVYNLAENYPFSPANMYLARKWREGLFGELMYAEYEYVHECRSLCYTYIDGVPVQPGNCVHNWRSWLNFHYYCTHSLGPVMVITGTRPTRVVALPGQQQLAGYLAEKVEGMGGIAPSLINMDNGAVVRNLMGATTNDTHSQRLWGTLGSAEIGPQGLLLRLGASGGGPKLAVQPRPDKLTLLAARTGHGGGDFWVLYYFARQILTGEPGPFDVYGAADVTIPGILAVRSSLDGGRAYDVPNLRLPADRDRCRDDRWAQKRFPVDAAFPPGADPEITRHFSKTMAELIRYSTDYRAAVDWSSVADEVIDPSRLVEILRRLVSEYPALKETYARARRIIDACPGSHGARVLREMLEDIGGEQAALSGSFLGWIKRRLSALYRRCGGAAGSALTKPAASALVPLQGGIQNVRPPAAGIKFAPVPLGPGQDFVDIRASHQGAKDGVVYVRGSIRMPRGGAGKLLYGADGPVKVWVNGRSVGCAPHAINPIVADQYSAPVKWRKGPNKILFALCVNQGRAWGLTARGVIG